VTTPVVPPDVDPPVAANPPVPMVPDDPDPVAQLLGPPELATLDWTWQPDAALASQLNRLSEQLDEGTEADAIVARTAVGATIVWVGYVLYSLRGGALLGTLLTSLPLWRWMDPLPILDENDAKLGKSKLKAAKRDRDAKEKDLKEDDENETDEEGPNPHPLKLLTDN
jgi:hypothetical protein